MFDVGDAKLMFDPRQVTILIIKSDFSGQFRMSNLTVNMSLHFQTLAKRDH